MRRIDRVVGEARLLRVLRAARAQTPELLCPAEASVPDVEVWPRDCAVAMRILDDLRESDREVPPSGDASGDGWVDRRRGGPLAVFDPAVLVPFIDAVQVAIAEVVERMDPTALVMAQLEPAVLAKVGWAAGDASIPSSRDPGARFDPTRARRAAIGDACVLAWEASLLEAVRRVFLANDLRRPFKRGSEVTDLRIVDTAIRSDRAMRARADRQKVRRRGSRSRGAAGDAGSSPEVAPLSETGSSPEAGSLHEPGPCPDVASGARS